MQKFRSFTTRRSFLRLLVSGGLGSVAGSIPLLRQALAMGIFDIPAGMYKVQGRVEVNGVAAVEGSLVGVGDVVETGAGGLAIFVVGKDVFLVRENSRLELGSPQGRSVKADIAEVLRIMKGQMLAVFGSGQKRLQMPTATVGVRGTGVYVEADPKQTYFCTCYGISEVRPVADPTVSLVVETDYHDTPLYIYASRADSKTNSLIEDAPVLNHTDDELIMLESIVFRKPPFYDQENPSKGGY